MAYRYNKYHAKKVQTIEGVFDSQKEYNRWLQLKAMAKNGIIQDLKRQVRFELIPSQKDEHGKTIELPVHYIADFVYKLDGELVVEDAKGMKTDVYIVKRKLMLYIHNIRVKEV